MFNIFRGSGDSRSRRSWDDYHGSEKQQRRSDTFDLYNRQEPPKLEVPAPETRKIVYEISGLTELLTAFAGMVKAMTPLDGVPSSPESPQVDKPEKLEHGEPKSAEPPPQKKVPRRRPAPPPLPASMPKEAREKVWAEWRQKQEKDECAPAAQLPERNDPLIPLPLVEEASVEAKICPPPQSKREAVSELDFLLAGEAATLDTHVEEPPPAEEATPVEEVVEPPVRVTEFDFLLRDPPADVPPAKVAMAPILPSGRHTGAGYRKTDTNF